MTGARAMLARVQRLEQARSPVSPIVRWCGSLEAWEAEAMDKVEEGNLDRADMLVVIASIRRWHNDGVFAQ